MSQIHAEMPLLVRHEGVWEGTYTFIAPTLEVLDRYDFRIRVSFPDDGQGGRTYRQESDYRWPDGRTQSLVFEGTLGDGGLRFDNGRIQGRMRELDETTLYLAFGFTAEPEVEVCEMIQLSADGQHRARTWHWFRNGKLFQTTLVDERRAA